MKIDLEKGEVSLTLNGLELKVIKHSFAEICYGFHLEDFEKKIGLSKEEAVVFLKNLNPIYRENFKTYKD